MALHLEWLTEFCHKRRIKSQEVYKWKARLNVHGCQQEHGVHYWDTYAPVVTWQTVRFFLILSLLLGWRCRQLDFVMAYPQAPAEMPLYLRLPQGYNRKGMTRKSHVLKLKRNVYGQKQVGRVIQFPPEMDENWGEIWVSKLGQISRTKLAEDAVLCVHNTASALNR